MTTPDPYDIPIFHSDWVRPGMVLIGDFSAILSQPHPPIHLPSETPGQEAQRIVREGLQAAFPDLVLPPRQLTRRERIERLIAYDTRLGLLVLKPESFVKVIGP